MSVPVVDARSRTVSMFAGAKSTLKNDHSKMPHSTKFSVGNSGMSERNSGVFLFHLFLWYLNGRQKGSCSSLFCISQDVSLAISPLLVKTFASKCARIFSLE